ncbi:MAG: hypothetical protein ACXACF_01600 [Candidatus Hermodarchaeia archaeon]|jgi:hypothetical protein
MTEYNYLIYCPTCKEDKNFLGGTSKAICYNCGTEVTEPMEKNIFKFKSKPKEKETKEEYEEKILSMLATHAQALAERIRLIQDIIESEYTSESDKEKHANQLVGVQAGRILFEDMIADLLDVDHSDVFFMVLKSWRNLS